MIDRDELQAKADTIGWFHSIDLGNGVVTKGVSDPSKTVRRDQLPDLAGRSVLDIGAWDGYYSYLAERSGASRVVALDHYVWGVDMQARERYWRACRESGTLPDHTRDVTEFWRDDLPGRRAFDFAHDALDSKVEPVVADFATTDVGALGEFDVVLYLGVLYHMKEPLTCLERLRAVTREVAVIETVALDFPDGQGHALLEFYDDSELNLDFGNWYQPNIEALRALTRAAGFSRVDVVQGPPPEGPLSTRSAIARRLGVRRGPRPIREYRAIVHAFP